ncbi:MAG: 3-deoxy-D-manno-octulosonic acid transferase [Saprospiraceae bacterium]|nr:3-deoxy-D-manno-octulosonic acid transferase [Pyrinomonadaceae bacterium]
MYLLYSLLLTLAFVLMSPLFILRREKYAAGFQERLGNYPEFKHDGRKVIWLHCVSVGETNAARPLVDEIKTSFPDHRLIVSTTTKTGQELAQNIFSDKADAVFYFPFDWKFSVRRALHHFKPDIVLLMETEIWPRFLSEAKIFGAKNVIVNGRISARSFKRYSYISRFVREVLSNIDLALMQDEDDGRYIRSLGVPVQQIRITGNIKFDLQINDNEKLVTENFRNRFGFSQQQRLIVAASTHDPEEKWIVDSFRKVYDLMASKPRLLVAPRHPERFNEVADIIRKTGFSLVNSSAKQSEDDKKATVILLDSIGELRAVYPLAEIVFVGGSLIPHGGQNILEPALAGKAIVTGPYTHNFSSAVSAFLESKALIQLPEMAVESQTVEQISKTFERLLNEPAERDFLGANAEMIMKANRGATGFTIDALKQIL